MLVPFVPGGDEDPVRITSNRRFPGGAIKVAVQTILNLSLAARLKRIVVTRLDMSRPNLGCLLIGKQRVIVNALRSREIRLLQVRVCKDAIVMQTVEDIQTTEAVSHRQINGIQSFIP